MKIFRIVLAASVAALCTATLALAEGGNEDQLVSQTADAHIVRGLEIINNNSSLNFGRLAKDNADDSKCWMAPDGTHPATFAATGLAANPADGECNYETETYVGSAPTGDLSSHVIRQGQYDVSGEPSYSYELWVDQPGSPGSPGTALVDSLILQRIGGTETMPVRLTPALGGVGNGIGSTTGGGMTYLSLGKWDGQLDGSGNQTVWVGGTLMIDNAQVSGHYNGVFGLYVQYN